MAGAASAHQAAIATREDTSQQRAGRRRRSSADPQRAQQGATAAAAAAPAARDSLSRLQLLADASPQVAQLRRLQALADGHYAPVAQLAGDPQEEELIQGNFASAEVPPQRQQAPRTNNSGLPDQLKSGIESLSGLSMDPVRVHYNSAQPAQLNALAYAQGSDIHLAPGQERHLPHEAWHVVQQAQGRVRPTLQLKDGVQVNDDAGLEREADVMGSKALEGGHRAVETHRSISMPIDTAQRIEGDALNSPEAIVANNHSAPLANGQGSAQRGGNAMQRIAYQCAQAALQRQVQAWGDGSDRVEELRVWQRAADGRGVGGKSQDLTPGFTAQRQAQERGGHLSTQLASSPRQLAQRRLIGQMLGSAVQRVEGELDEEEGGAAHLRSEPVQRVEGGLDEEEEPPAAAQLLDEPAQLEENRTGMPDGLKAGIESLSGMDMSDVRVHRNSSAPEQLNALSYAQGNDIHLAPGQEQHLPHEAWHVVQQRQGRVQATMQMAGVRVNDDLGLESEADLMGGRAVQTGAGGGKRQDLTPKPVDSGDAVPGGAVLQPMAAPVQRQVDNTNVDARVREALRAGERLGELKVPLISTQENVDVLLPMITHAAGELESMVDLSGSWNFQVWAEKALRRLEVGAQALAEDITHWVTALQDAPQVRSVEVLLVTLTGSEVHDRGLGVSFLDVRIARSRTADESMSVDRITNPGPVAEEIRRFVLKPDDRSFEKALLGSQSDSVARQLNEKAGLGEHSISTIGMEADPKHGSIVEYVEENLVTYLQSWCRYWRGDDQPVVEAIAFAFLTGLWDLYSENVKMIGGKPVFIDAEVGMQPRIMKDQHALGNERLRNDDGMPAAQHVVVDRQLQGQGGRGSQLLAWAKAHPDELFKVLRKAIGNTVARIVPVFTRDWFRLKENFLSGHFYSDIGSSHEEKERCRKSAKTQIETAVEIVCDGRDNSPGLKRQVGNNKMGATNLLLLRDGIEEDFMQGLIPEFNYQPATGRVMHHGNVFWEGQDLNDALSHLRERLQ